MAKSILETPSCLAGRNMLYIAYILIDSLIHIRNLKDPREKNLLQIVDLLISSQIYAKNLI